MRYRAGFHAIDATKKIPEQLKDLDRHRRAGDVKRAPEPQVIRDGHVVPWCFSYETDNVCLVEAKTMVCYQAAIVLATAMTLEDLGIEQHPLPTANTASAAKQSFLEVQRALAATPFTLYRFYSASIKELFMQTAGVYLIHTHVTHPEDWDFEYAELIDHYVAFNAGTRVLYLYPEVVVVLDSDLEDFEHFVARLRAPPFCMRLPTYSSFVRQIMMTC